MNEEYREELRLLKVKMEKAEEFAKKVPLFAEKILKEKITGEEAWHKYIDSYKRLTTYHGVFRGYFKTGTSRYITNLNEHDGYYWTLYINTLGEYNSHAKYGLNEVKDLVDVFFYDISNSTFYCTDEQIEPLLETLNEWKIKAVEFARKDSLNERLRTAEKEKQVIQDKIDKLKEE